MLDGLLGNETDLPVFEYATDTHGATLANFALFDLVGKQLSPRIRDLGKITLYRTGPNADFLARYPRAGGLLTRRLNTDLITSTWDDLLRVAASVQGGHATAALVVGKLCSSKRQQNALTSAIKEYGALRRTVYAARYLADETYRRRIAGCEVFDACGREGDQVAAGKLGEGGVLLEVTSGAGQPVVEQDVGGVCGALRAVADDAGECRVADQVEGRLSVRGNAEGGEVFGQLGSGQRPVRAQYASDQVVDALA